MQDFFHQQYDSTYHPWTLTSLTGKSPPFSTGNSSSNGGCFIVMLVFGGGIWVTKNSYQFIRPFIGVIAPVLTSRGPSWRIMQQQNLPIFLCNTLSCFILDCSYWFFGVAWMSRVCFPRDSPGKKKRLGSIVSTKNVLRAWKSFAGREQQKTTKPWHLLEAKLACST